MDASAGSWTGSGDRACGRDRRPGAPEADVLIVEDDPDVRAAMIAIVEMGGYSVVAAEDGWQAMQLLKAGLRPRLILLDLMLPRMSGREFREAQLRDEALGSIPVVLCSALDGVEHYAVRLGAIAGLMKPVDIDQLLHLIDEHCGAA